MIDVVCTGRDTHERHWLAEVDEAEPMRPRRGRRRLSDEEQRQMDSSTAKPGHDPLYVDAFHFRCSECGSHRELRSETWQKLMDGVIAGGMTTLDLSRLPF